MASFAPRGRPCSMLQTRQLSRRALPPVQAHLCWRPIVIIYMGRLLLGWLLLIIYCRLGTAILLRLHLSWATCSMGTLRLTGRNLLATLLRLRSSSLRLAPERQVLCHHGWRPMVAAEWSSSRMARTLRLTA